MVDLFKRKSLRLQRQIEKTQYQLIQLISIKRTYLEKRDKKKFRELAEIPKEITLSEKQVVAATSHARETLVVAGAGSGKTFVLVGRAKYLINSKRVPEEKILMLAFNKDAAKELAERTKSSGINVRAQTFHSFGNFVLKTTGQNTGAAFGDDGEISRFVAKFIDSGLDETGKKDLAFFFATETVPKRDFETFSSLTEYNNYVRTVIPRTLNNELVKSHGEWLIANFLFVNSIGYEYESQYKVEADKSSVHKPDFMIENKNKKIWIEYFGIDRNSNTIPDINKEKYLSDMEWKKETHKKNNTTLIDLYFYDLLEDKLLYKLEKALRKHGVTFKLKKPAEILAAANDIGYTTRFNKLLEQFLKHTRSKRLNDIDLAELAKGNTRNEKFISIFNQFYKSYIDRLSELEQPDFAEQIHGAADLISNGEYEFNFSHVLVDEFQDISFDRFRLLNAMQSANPKIEMTYVGDDWQSIYRFGGSDISIMRQVSKPTMKRKRVDLDSTFRLPQKIADISSQFILKNPNQLEKNVFSKSEIKNLGNIYIHWDTRYRDVVNNIQQICAFIGDDANKPEFSLKILGRYQSNLPKLKDIEQFWQGPIDISTVHAAKGLESDYVIVVDLVQDIRGFPSTIEDDPVLQMVVPSFEEFEHEEERRLFYVAITRSRIETHLISPLEKPSLFTLEMLEDNLGTHIGVPQDTKKLCPACNAGTIIKKNNNSYCSNIPTCEFFTPFCSECNKPMDYLGSNKQRFECEKHSKVIYENCRLCSWGALVPRVNSVTQEIFYSCHTWKSTKCRGKGKTNFSKKKI